MLLSLPLGVKSRTERLPYSFHNIPLIFILRVQYFKMYMHCGYIQGVREPDMKPHTTKPCTEHVHEHNNYHGPVEHVVNIVANCLRKLKTITWTGFSFAEHTIHMCVSIRRIPDSRSLVLCWCVRVWQGD